MGLSPGGDVGLSDEVTGAVVEAVRPHRLREAVFMHRYLRASVHAGLLTPDHKIFADTVASRRLASLKLVPGHT